MLASTPTARPGRDVDVESAKPLLIYGSRSFAHTVRDLARDLGYRITGLIDDYADGPGIVGTLQSARTAFPPSAHAMAIGIGYRDLASRRQALQRVFEGGWSMPVLVHPRAYVAASARLGPGCVVMAGAIVDRECELGAGAVVWPGACINHDVRIGKNCFISPNATLCGHVQVGDDVFVGAAAAIADHCQVPAGSFVKMHARYTGCER